MDSNGFDSLARSFGQTRSRRQALVGLAGAVTGVLALGGREAGARTCKSKGKACTKSRQCCSKNCTGGRCQARCGTRPPRAVTVTFSPTDITGLCTVDIHLRGFAANTTYTVDVTAAAPGSESTLPQSVTTDGCGSADFSAFAGSAFPTDTSIRAAVGTVSSGELVPVACSA